MLRTWNNDVASLSSRQLAAMLLNMTGALSLCVDLGLRFLKAQCVVWTKAACAGVLKGSCVSRLHNSLTKATMRTCSSKQEGRAAACQGQAILD